MLVNIVNLSRDGIPIIWLIKLKKWEELGYDIYIHTGLFIKHISLKDRDVYQFNATFSELAAIPQVRLSKLGYIWYALKRNGMAFASYTKVRGDEYDVMYTPSAVLEFILFPWVYRVFNSNIRWAVEFDNTVPLRGPGSKVVRLLAWLFFKISVVLLRRADVVFAITPILKDYLVKAGFKEAKVAITGFAVETDKLLAATSNTTYRIDALFMGRLNEKKGIYDLLEVLSLVKKTLPEFQLAIMGNGDPATVASFNKRIADLQLESNVQLLGYRTGAEKYAIIKASKLFWLFSYDESFGVALLEAVCMGKPAMVYDLPIYHYLYTNNELMTFARNDYQTIAAQTIQLYKTRSFANPNGALLLNKYSWDNIVQLEYQALHAHTDLC